MSLRLLVFDVDGTLVDSQAQIMNAMAEAFAVASLPAPERDAVRAIIGLSLPVAMDVLAPNASHDTRQQLVEAYKDAYVAQRTEGGAEAASPLYPGARDALAALAEDDTLLLGVATGKSRRGLDHLFEIHDLRHYFVTAQVADDHPSKPHPSMLWQALSETGVTPDAAAMIGDTRYDMEMARAAGVHALGVSWGYHPTSDLREAGAASVIATYDALGTALETLWRQT